MQETVELVIETEKKASEIITKAEIKASSIIKEAENELKEKINNYKETEKERFLSLIETAQDKANLEKEEKLKSIKEREIDHIDVNQKILKRVFKTIFD